MTLPRTVNVAAITAAVCQVLPMVLTAAPVPPPFQTPLIGIFTPDGKRIRVLADLICDVPGYGRITVPAGFNSNFASTPSWLWSIYAPIGRYTYAAIVHDYLYCVGAVIDLDGHQTRTVSRKEADHILRVLMQLGGCRPQTPWAFWVSVRLAGWVHWQKSPV